MTYDEWLTRRDETPDDEPVIVPPEVIVRACARFGIDPPTSQSPVPFCAGDLKRSFDSFTKPDDESGGVDT
jgi:hypothetical protein